jgi:diadenosine tetraphosphate (Ap4A) HIT family hydrolase
MTGRDSGVDYDFSNIYTKVLSGKVSTHKIHENSHVFAYLASEPASKGHVTVITKAEGFPTFLDMPHSKAAELTRELPKLAQAVKAATGASDITICSQPGPESAVGHPKFEVIPVYAGKYDKPKEALDSYAKDIVAKINEALHPPPPLKKAKFFKVGKINPDSKGFNICVKATSDETEKELPKGGKAYEVQVGDDSGVVTVSLSASQKGSLQKGSVYELRNAAVRMIKGHVSVQVDKWGKIEKTEDEVNVNTDKDISATEYELVKS